MLIPKLFSTLKTYNRRQSAADLTAGVIAGIVALPHAQPIVALQRSALADETPDEDLVGNIDDALNLARRHWGLEPVERRRFATPAVTREDRRQHPR